MTWSLLPRQDTPTWLQIASLAGGITLGLFLATTVLLVSGVSLAAILQEFILYSFTDPHGLAQTVTGAVPLLMVGLASAVALKLRFWNIGIDGQVWLGAIAATGIAIADIGPPELRLWLMAGAGFLAGAAWIGLPVVLRLRFGVNEVIATLMLTYVAFLLVQHLLYGEWRGSGIGFPVSEAFDDPHERLSRVGWGRVHSGLWLAIIVAAAVSFLMLVSRFGFYLTAVGENPRGALAAGLPVTATLVLAVLLAGGLCGLAGFTIVAGQEYRLTQYIAHGYTFSGILVAFLARFNPLAVIPVALAIAGLFTAGETLKTFYQLPQAIILVVESLILLSVVLVDFLARYRLVPSHGPAAKPPARPAPQAVEGAAHD